MRKLLSLLSVLTITGTSLPTTIAASNYKRHKRQTPTFSHTKVPISNVIGITDFTNVPLFMIDSNTIDTRYYDNNVSIIIYFITARNTSTNLNNQNLIIDEINGSGARIRGTLNSPFYGSVNISFSVRPIFTSVLSLGEITNNNEETILSAFRNNNRNIITDSPNFFSNTRIRRINFNNITNNSARINFDNFNNIGLVSLMNNMNLTVTFSLINDETINYISLSSLINYTNLGVLNDNNDQTILERFISLNPRMYLTTNELRIIRKSENSARIISVQWNVQGNVDVTFSIKRTRINEKSSYDDDSNSKKRRKSNIISSFELQQEVNKIISRHNTISKEQKQQKLNEINQYYQSLPENEQNAFKDKLRDVGIGLTSAGISGSGILGISKITGISPIKGLSTTTNYIKNSLLTTRTVVSSETEEVVEMTPLLSESTVAEGLTAAETLSVAEATTVVATEGAVIGTEAGTAAALSPETLGLSLLIGGLIIAGTAIIWWLSSDNTLATKQESHNQYNEIEKYYKFLAHDQLKLDITINEWNKIKQIYQENSNNYQEFKNKIKSEITNFHKEDHSGWGGSISDSDINILIKIIFNHFQEISNHFLSNPNHGWKIITNTVGNYFMIEAE